VKNADRNFKVYLVFMGIVAAGYLTWAIAAGLLR